MFSTPRTEIFIPQILYSNQLENLGHIERNLILFFKVKNGPIIQPKSPIRKAVLT